MDKTITYKTFGANNISKVKKKKKNHKKSKCTLEYSNLFHFFQQLSKTCDIPQTHFFNLWPHNIATKSNEGTLQGGGGGRTNQPDQFSKQ